LSYGRWKDANYVEQGLAVNLSAGRQKTPNSEGFREQAVQHSTFNAEKFSEFNVGRWRLFLYSIVA